MFGLGRYIGVAQPMKTQSLSTIEMAHLQMGVIVIISILLEIPRYFEYEIRQFSCNGQRYYLAVKTDLWQNDVYFILYRSTFTLIVRRICPLVIISTLTFLMIKHLQKQNHIRKGLLADPTFTNRKRLRPLPSELLTKVLAMIAFVYVLCLFPAAIYPILRHFIESNSCTSFFNVFAVSMETLGILNSALNFFIYYPNIPLFRECLKEMFSNCKCKRNRNKVYPSRNSVKVVVTVVSRVEVFPQE